MQIKKMFITNIVIAFVLLSVIQVAGNQNNDTTTLEIADIRGGIFGITADIKNTGSVAAEKFTITISVKGGLFNNIDIFHECGGCGSCGETIPTGEIKSENTKESGWIIGFGQIDIVVTAEAENADLITEETTGFVFGPLILII